MDEGQDRRDRLARLQLERMSRQPDEGWQSGLGQFIDRWSGATTGAAWEKAFFAGAVLLVAALAIAGLFMLITSVMGGSGGKKDVAANVARPTATGAAPTVVRPTPTTIVIAVPTYPTAAPTPRTDCAAIAGSSYQSDAEREFFLQNCVSPTEGPTEIPTAAPSDGNGPVPTEPPPEPTQPPPTPPGFGASDAINAGSYWMSLNGYSAIGGCNAFDTGSHWVVTCSATSASGQSTVSVCVFQDPLAVRPSAQC